MLRFMPAFSESDAVEFAGATSDRCLSQAAFRQATNE